MIKISILFKSITILLALLVHSQTSTGSFYGNNNNNNNNNKVYQNSNQSYRFECFMQPRLQQIDSWQDGQIWSMEFKLNNIITDWLLEVHFTHDIKSLEIWPLGKLANPFNVLNAEEKIFIIKPLAGEETVKSLFRIDLMFDNDKDLPKIHMAALCGKVKYNTPLTTGKPLVTTIPTTSTPAFTPVCTTFVKDKWANGYTMSLSLPVVKTMKDWIIELKFDRNVTYLELWDCLVLSRTNTSYTCHNRQDNGLSRKNTIFQFDFNVYFDINKYDKPKLQELWFGFYKYKIV